MKDIAIIGGGAAGVACAIKLKQVLGNNINVTILEKQSRIGKKILMTGNGKCNITNTDIDAKHYNLHAIEIIKQYDYFQIKQFFNDLGLMLRVDEAGRVYPYSEKANTVVDILLNALNDLGVRIITDYEVGDIKARDRFLVYANDYQVYNFDYIVMATGGKASFTGEYLGYKLMQRLGHRITDLQPGLVALKTKANLRHLSGIRVKGEAKIIINGEDIASTVGEILFKNDGLSGIAIFALSRFYQPGVIISINLIPGITKAELRTYFKDGLSIERVLSGMLPKMVYLDIINRCHELTIENVITKLENYDFQIIDTYGYPNAQITVGGVDAKEINPFTCESLMVNNMYIIGELADVDGNTGGYNLHYAWSSGIAAATDIARKINESEDGNE